MSMDTRKAVIFPALMIPSQVWVCEEKELQGVIDAAIAQRRQLIDGYLRAAWPEITDLETLAKGRHPLSAVYKEWGVRLVPPRET